MGSLCPFAQQLSGVTWLLKVHETVRGSWLGVGCKLRLQHDPKEGPTFGADTLREPNRDKVTPIPWERWFCHLSIKLTLAHLFLFLNLNFFLIESIKRVVSAFLSQLLWGWDELILWQCSTLRQVLCKCEPELSVRGDHCSSDPLCPSGALIPDGEGVLFPLNVFWMSWEFPDSQGGAFGFW